MENQPPFQLKNIYNTQVLGDYAELVQKTWKPFPVQDFLKNVFDENWIKLELKERTRHISDQLRRHLPQDYKEATQILTETVRRMLAQSGEKMVFEHGFIPDFVERFGTDEPDVSIPAMETITRWTSAEFAVRPFLLKHPERMFQQMLDWSGHESAMVRRLSSEGFRPRLPWGMGVPVLKKDPSPILPVLEKLKNDPAETVRRSVANNLNDISKDHPGLVLQIAGRWLGKSPETDWIVRHACRSLLKKGDATALAHFGFEKELSGIAIGDFSFSEKVRLGGQLDFSFSVKNTSETPANIRLEYAIDFITSTGKISRKVFKIKELEIISAAEIPISKKQSFKDFTTRKHFAGSHQLAILVNGKVLTEGSFEVL